MNFYRLQKVTITLKLIVVPVMIVNYFKGKKIENDLWTPKSTKLLSDQDFGCELSIDDLMAEPGKVDRYR